LRIDSVNRRHRAVVPGKAITDGLPVAHRFLVSRRGAPFFRPLPKAYGAGTDCQICFGGGAEIANSRTGREMRDIFALDAPKSHDGKRESSSADSSNRGMV